MLTRKAAMDNSLNEKRDCKLHFAIVSDIRTGYRFVFHIWLEKILWVPLEIEEVLLKNIHNKDDNIHK